MGRKVRLQLDKAHHFLAGYAIAMTFIPFGDGWAIFACVSIALAKELVWDWLLKRGTPELWDFTATVCGGTAAILYMSGVN